MSTPDAVLERVLRRARDSLASSLIQDDDIRSRVEYLCRQSPNRACPRLLMACLLAKIERPDIDPRKPYTEIGDSECFSGRTYDEKYLSHFIYANDLPLNPTTAFLTPAFRNLNKPLTAEVVLVGRPRRAYAETLRLLDEVYRGKLSPEDLLAEIVRLLLLLRDEKQARLNRLVSDLALVDDLPLSSEEIIALIEQHLKCKDSSRLPVIVVAAAYESVRDRIRERALPLQGHLAADEQTGSLGDVEICLENEDDVVTVYEMKAKRVTADDIDRAIQKIAKAPHSVHNYIFITTDVITEEVTSHARSCYEKLGGTEVAVLNCVGFLRHFLHFFHRSRSRFLDEYQKLLLHQPESAVSQPLKEAFLILRQAAQASRE